MSDYTPYSDWTSLLARFKEMDRLAAFLRSPNPDDDHMVKLAIVGFSFCSPTSQWSLEHFRSLCTYRQDMSPKEFSRSWIAFACLAWGHLLGIQQAGRLSEQQLLHAEALLPGFMWMHPDEIESLAVAEE